MLDDFWKAGPTICKMFVLVFVCVCVSPESGGPAVKYKMWAEKA